MKTTHPNKATHMGHCQLCGNFQKLPQGALSKHGYTKEWGFFAGTCPGSGWLPFEVSTDRIEQGIIDAELSARRLRHQIAEVRANEGPVVMRRDYNTKGKPWKPFTLKMDGTRTGLHMQYSAANDAELVAKFNSYYAGFLEVQVAGLVDYIKWLSERKAGWKPAELKAVAA